MIYIYSLLFYFFFWYYLVFIFSFIRVSVLDIRVLFFFSVFLYFFVRSWYRLFIRFRLVLGIELFRVFCREVILNVVIFCKKKIIIVNVYKIILKIIFIKGLRKFWLLRKNK